MKGSWGKDGSAGELLQVAAILTRVPVLLGPHFIAGPLHRIISWPGIHACASLIPTCNLFRFQLVKAYFRRNNQENLHFTSETRMLLCVVGIKTS